MIMKTLSKGLALILIISIFTLFYCMQIPIIKETFTTEETLKGPCNSFKRDVNSITDRDIFPVLNDEEHFTNPQVPDNEPSNEPSNKPSNEPSLDLPGLPPSHVDALYPIKNKKPDILSGPKKLIE